MSEEMLRVALVLEGEYLPSWQYHALERVNSLGHVRLGMVLFTPVTARHFGSRRLGAHIFYWLRMLEARLFRVRSNALKPTSVLPLLQDIPLLRLDSPDTGAKFCKLPVDLVINLTASEILPDYVYSRPAYGVWQYFQGNHCAEMCWAGVSEYLQGLAEVRSGVMVRNRPQQAAHYLFASTGSTEASLTQTADALFWKMAAVLPELLAGLKGRPPAEDFIRRANGRFGQELSGGAVPPACFGPGAVAFSRLGMRCMNNLLRLIWGKFYYSRIWVLLAHRAVNPTDVGLLPLAKPLLPPANHFWADPFLLEQEGKTYVVFEEFVFQQGKGRLACLELRADGSHSLPMRVLERPYHLSYPFLFRFRGELYLIPESAENHTIDLYRCEHFPDRWVYVKTLMDKVEAYDATLHEHGGRWWMFVNLRHHPEASPHELLYLFSASTPLDDEWEPHPCNPIVTHAASARPAGALFVQDGKIYRPSQNCVGSYGRGLNINQVIEWNRHQYTEKMISQCIPAGTASLEGLHTLTFIGDRVVSDGIYVQKRWRSQDE